MIRVESLSCVLSGRKVLDGITFQVPEGDVLGVLGPNGSGKTTLLLALAGIIRPERGSIRIQGRDIATLRSRQTARMVATVPQNGAAPEGMTALDCVLMGRYPHHSLLGGYTAMDRALALRAMEDMAVAGLAHRRITELSGGERQKVFLARALAQDCPTLLLDEPTSALDVSSSLAFLGLVRQRAVRGGAAICALHDLNLAALFCSRLLFLDRGCVVLSGPTHEVFTSETLSRIYATRVLVANHPGLDVPQAFFVPGGAGRDAV